MKGEPFEKCIKRYLPNVMTRFCTEELKVRTMKRYLVNELGWKKWSSAIGIRHDEQHRCRKESKDRWVFWYPLVLSKVANKQFQILGCQPFDLRLMNVKGATPNSNCDLCFLKSEATLAAMAREHPDGRNGG